MNAILLGLDSPESVPRRSLPQQLYRPFAAEALSIYSSLMPNIRYEETLGNSQISTKFK